MALHLDRPSSTPPNWRCSWRLNTPDYTPGKFSQSERFYLPGQGGKARIAAQISNGQHKVKKLLGSQFKKSYVVQRKNKFWSSPGPVYVNLQTKDELDPSINPQMFSKYQRFVPELKVTNQLKDRGFHKLALNHDLDRKSHGYIKPIKQSKARLLKERSRQPPHTYLGIGVHIANLERPISVHLSKTDRFYNTMDKIKASTPGPGNYKRPEDTVKVHRPNRASIPFCPPHQQRPRTVGNLDRFKRHAASTTAILPRHKKNAALRRMRIRNNRYKGGGDGVKFSTYFEKSMMFNLLKTPHLGPGCYPESAQTKLNLETRSSTSVRFNPLPLPRPKTTNSLGARTNKKMTTSGVEEGGVGENDGGAMMWPRPMYAVSSIVSRDNFEDHFWALENRQNGREEVEEEEDSEREDSDGEEE